MMIGVEVDGVSKAYPFSELEKTGKSPITDEVNRKQIKIEYNAEGKSAEIFDAQDNLIPAVTNFWFAWFAFHPDTKIFKAD